MSEKAVPISEEQANQMMAKQAQQQERADAMTEQKESMMRAFVTAEGRERIKRIEQVKEERARQVEAAILHAVRAGQLQPPLSDDVVRELIQKVVQQEQEQKETKITVMRKRTDDDW